MVDLLPCPFCGGEAISSYEYLKGEHSVGCTKCHVTTGTLRDSENVSGVKQLVAKIWNTRAPQWQPIETAPKDGTTIMVWNDAEEKKYSGCWWGKYEDKSRWIKYGAGWCGPNKLTHWQPLPQPPEEIK